MSQNDVQMIIEHISKNCLSVPRRFRKKKISGTGLRLKIWQNSVYDATFCDIFKAIWQKIWPEWSIKSCFYAPTIKYSLEECILSYFIILYLKNQGKFAKFRTEFVKNSSKSREFWDVVSKIWQKMISFEAKWP